MIEDECPKCLWVKSNTSRVEISIKKGARRQVIKYRCPVCDFLLRKDVIRFKK